jgi:hypothetical protein
MLFCSFFKCSRIFNQKYIILWLVKPNKAYNEFAAKYRMPINFFAEGVKGIQELLSLICTRTFVYDPA